METTDRKLRMPERLRAAVEASARAQGISMNSEMVRRLEDSLEQDSVRAERERSFAEAMTLAYGHDNGALLHLMGEVARVFAPRGEWRDDPAVRASLTRGIVHVFQRLAAPTDGHFIRDRSPEGLVDQLLFELGDDGSAHPGPLTYLQRWAADKRQRLGALGLLLVEMRRTVRVAQEAMSPGEPREANPDAVASWPPAHGLAQSSDPQVHVPRVRQFIGYASDADLTADDRADAARQAEELVDALAKQGLEAATVADLRRELDAARKSEEGE